MVKRHEKVWYTCDICGSRYEDEESALLCEALPNLPDLPKGLMFSQDYYKDIVFALACPESGKHTKYYDPTLWAARDNGYNHNLPGDGFCGGGSLYPNAIKTPDKDSFLLYVMVHALHKAGIEPTVMQEGKVIGFEEFMGCSVEEYLSKESVK